MAHRAAVAWTLANCQPFAQGGFLLPPRSAMPPRSFSNAENRPNAEVPTSASLNGAVLRREGRVAARWAIAPYRDSAFKPPSTTSGLTN